MGAVPFLAEEPSNKAHGVAPPHSTTIIAAVKRLVAILRPRGTLYLSWRVTAGEDQRDERGRLYSAFDPAFVFQGLASEEILLDDRRVSASSGKSIQCVIARKLAVLAREVAS